MRSWLKEYTMLLIKNATILLNGNSKQKEVLLLLKKEAVKELFTEEELESYGDLVGKYFNKAQKNAVRELVLSEGLVWTVVKLPISDRSGVR